MSEMVKILINISASVRECLQYMVLKKTVPEDSVGSLIERLIREHPDVEKARKAAKIKFAVRKGMGRPPKKTE